MTATPADRIPKVAHRYHAARAAVQSERDILAELVRAACDEGMTEAEAAKVAGVNRLTVRAWRGKARRHY